MRHPSVAMQPSSGDSSRRRRRSPSKRTRPLKLMNQLIKSSAVSLAGLCAAASLLAQSEPQKSPPLGSSPSRGSVNRSESAPQSGNPPPPVTTGASSTGDQAASTEDLRKAKPVDPANNDPAVKPADDFFLY